MAIIDYPTKNGVQYFQDNTIYLKADDATVNQYILESYSGHTLVSYEPEDQRFSNDGGLAYQYYGPFTGWVSPGVYSSGTTTMWLTEFGYQKIVKKLTIS